MVIQRLGLFSHVDEPGDAGDVYRATVELFTHAERLGVDTAWVAVRHFHSALAGLPSAFVLLSALATRTTRIGLGTAVVPLAFENPIRLAEDAAVLDALSGGRVELGVGKGLGMGFSTESFAAFHIDDGEREQRYTQALAALRGILTDTPLTDSGSTLYPPAAGLAERIWQATATPATTVAAAEAGDALQVHRGVPGAADSGAVQAEQIRTYLNAYRGAGPPRVGLSRGIVPADSRVAALELIRDALRANAVRQGKGPGPDRLDEVAAFADRMNTKYGSTEEVVDQLAGDPAVALATDLIVGFTPAVPTFAHSRELVELVAAQIAPALGWRHEPALVTR
jgi:alkanesulfonate monooxygenase SsuD/methylene tetrahydromethanopterin reductase-like flavin-dependent oxidoreductase (luciferase family)